MVGLPAVTAAAVRAALTPGPTIQEADTLAGLPTVTCSHRYRPHPHRRAAAVHGHLSRTFSSLCEEPGRSVTISGPLGLWPASQVLSAAGHR